MRREEIQKLLGGYATGTLTAEERDALFAAALEDQELFEALAREEPLRELLQDPTAKTRLRAGLEQRPSAGYWRWLRPAAWAIPAVGLAAILVTFVVQRQAPRRVMIAQAPALARTGPVEPAPTPLPQSLEPRRQAPLMEARREPKEAPAQAQTAGALKDQIVLPPAPPPPPVALAAPPPPPAAPAPADKETAGLTALSAAEAVRVEAATPGQAGGGGGFDAPQDARALFFGQPNATVFQTNLVERERQKSNAAPAVEPLARRASATPSLKQAGVRYSILRRMPNRQLAAVIPNEVLDANDEMVVRLESNEAGYLSVFERRPEGWRQLGGGRIDRLMPYTVPANGTLTFDGSGAKDLFVVFSRQPQQTPYPIPEARPNQIVSGNLAERLTYVVSTGAVTEPPTVAFPITLTHK